MRQLYFFNGDQCDHQVIADSELSALFILAKSLKKEALEGLILADVSEID